MDPVGGRFVEGDAWEERETMVKSKSLLPRPDCRDPSILRSFLLAPSSPTGSAITLTPSSVLKACMMSHLAFSCLAIVHHTLWRQISPWVIDSGSPQSLQKVWSLGSKSRMERADVISKSVSLSEELKGMTDSQALPRVEPASRIGFRSWPLRESSRVALSISSASWHCSRWGLDR